MKKEQTSRGGEGEVFRVSTHFRPEWSKASFFQHFPPAQEFFEIVPLSPDMELNQKLAKR